MQPSAQSQYKRKPNGIAEDLAQVIGFSNTLLLCGTRGGRTLYVPESAIPGHLLETLLGESAFRRLIEEFGGTTFDLPRLADFSRYQRIRRCAELLASGRSIHSAALLTGVTYQQAKNDRRSAELLGILPLVLREKGQTRSDAEVVKQLLLPGF